MTPYPDDFSVMSFRGVQTTTGYPRWQSGVWCTNAAVHRKKRVAGYIAHDLAVVSATHHARQVSRLAQGLGGDEGNVDSGGSASSSSSSTELHRLKLAAPVLSMDFCPSSAPLCGGGGSDSLLLAGGMDGSSHLVSVDGSRGSGGGDDAGDGCDGEEAKGNNGVALLASMKNHAKYVVVCRYSTLLVQLLRKSCNQVRSPWHQTRVFLFH